MSLQDVGHGLRILFLDLNSYFASVEQAERPELRGKPVVVAPVEAETTFAIAASYPAKAFGVHTGIRISEARRLCPGLTVVRGRPPLYAHYHERVLEAVSQVLPPEAVHSIDEMSFRLLGSERQRENARSLALELKRRIATDVSPVLTSSIGIAPNTFLAKVATEIEKPDGLTILEPGQIEDALRRLPLRALPGINRRMEARLRAAGIFDTPALLQRSAAELRRAFGSVQGERWWGLLRGHEVESKNRTDQSLSHSHVLPPRLRTEEGARSVLLRLASKAALRLRRTGLWADSLAVTVRGDPSWSAHVGLGSVQDTVSVLRAVEHLWQGRSFGRPSQVGVVLTGLRRQEAVTPSLFEDVRPFERLSSAMDAINARYGKDSVYLASLESARGTAEERIAFQKTSLLQEGKGDGEWPPREEPPNAPDSPR
jgi:DNA polymerase-4